MSRLLLVVAALTIWCILNPGKTMAQASEQAKQKVKEMESAQKKGWQQVDEINKEADNTRARLQQSRQSGEQAIEKSGYSVKKSSVGTKSAYRKSKHHKPHLKKEKK